MRQSASLLAILLTLQSAIAAELPVRKVILYKHGIGYFERGGEIPAGQSARLDFKAAEMNDVLKSLTIGDQTGNSVAGVRYDSSMPLDAKLAEFPFHLGDKLPLTDFLDQLKGADVELKFGQNSVKGQIVGARVAQGRDKAQTVTDTISILGTGGELTSHDLGSATSIRLSNPELQLQLTEYLRSLNASRSREQKSVYIDSARDAARKLSVAYTIPMPVWKSSYRLVLDNGAAKKPLLEGWAIIDNTTSEDWTNVNLSVISGRPISFISNLYEPKFMERRTAELEEAVALAPPVYKAGMPAAPPARAELRAGIAGFGPGMGGGGFAPQASSMVRNIQESASNVTVQTEVRDAGELFEYKFSKPVTVKRNESAMLPFVQQDIDARKLLIFTEGSSYENPFNSAELTNNTGKTLDGGPLSVYDGSVYAGEALINTFKPGDKRLLSYAMDLGTRVVQTNNYGPRLLKVMTASEGVLNQRFTREFTNVYTITNVDKKPKTLVVEHSIRYNHTLIGAKPTETTKTHHRFEVKLTGEPTQTLTIKSEETIIETIFLKSMYEQQLELLISGNTLSPEAKRGLQPLFQLNKQINASNSTIKALNDQSAESVKDQERVRQNLQSLNSISGQQERVQKYAADLAKLDERILTLRDQIAAETKKRNDLQTQLSQKIDATTF